MELIAIVSDPPYSPRTAIRAMGPVALCGGLNPPRPIRHSDATSFGTMQDILYGEGVSFQCELLLNAMLYCDDCVTHRSFSGSY